MAKTKISMYEGAPWCLGSYKNFEVNKPKLITLLNRDYAIWKDDSGNLNAIDNICPHAGASLAQGGYIVNFQGKNCLACPYHGNKVQFFGDGKVVIDGNVSNQAIQTVLPLQVVDGLVWTYGLNWRRALKDTASRRAASPLGQEINGKSVAQPIEPKLPIPDYSNVPHLTKSHTQLKLEGLNHIYSKSQSVDCNIAQAIWNIHDGEHFAGTHRDTMLSKEIKIDNLTQDEHKLSWQLILQKRDASAVKSNKMNLLVEKESVQSFNTFVPSLAIVSSDYKGKLIVSIVSMYPESPQNTIICLNTYSDSEFAWWQKLIKLPQLANQFRDRLTSEDFSILENLYADFEQKITLKNDTPAQLAMNYLQNWHD